LLPWPNKVLPSFFKTSHFCGESPISLSLVEETLVPEKGVKREIGRSTLRPARIDNQAKARRLATQQKSHTKIPSRWTRILAILIAPPLL
jgi:hypothetical protein